VLVVESAVATAVVWVVEMVAVWAVDSVAAMVVESVADLGHTLHQVLTALLLVAVLA